MRHLVLALLFIFGCGGGGNGPGSSSGGVTFRKVCQEIGQSVCDKVAMCSPPGESGCAAQFEQLCCQAQPDCDKDSGGTQDQLDDCLAAFDQLSCTQVENGDIPAERQ